MSRGPHAEGPPGPVPVPPLLEVEDLHVAFHGAGGPVRALRGVSFRLEAGETLGLVGESGCGKSVTAMSLTRLLREPPAEIGPGSSVRLRGEELLAATPGRLQRIRGAEIGMIFQEPSTSLNPVLRVGKQVEEAIRAHEDHDRATIRGRAVDLLARAGLTDPGRCHRLYPHQLSGGMRQRVMIAIALACGPGLLVADEPTTALDVTTQARILDLLAELRDEYGMGLLLISHDLAVVGRAADRVAVMYAGRIVEEGAVPDLFRAPAHPYTRGLLRAIPRIDGPRGSLEAIPGRVPHPRELGAGCPFAPRCPQAMARCRSEDPPPFPTPTGHSRCWLEEEEGDR